MWEVDWPEPCMIPPISSCYFTWSLYDSPVPPRVFVPHSPLGLSIMPLLVVASSISVPCWQPDLGVQYHPWSKVDIKGQSLHSIQWRAVDDSTWELIRGLGILVHPSLLALAYLQPTSFTERIFSSLYTWGRRDLGSV